MVWLTAQRLTAKRLNRLVQSGPVFKTLVLTPKDPMHALTTKLVVTDTVESAFFFFLEQN